MLRFARGSKILTDPFYTRFCEIVTLIRCVVTRLFEILSGDAKCSARHPLDLRGLAPDGKFIILFHYTSELGVANITNAKAKQVDGVCSSLIRSSIQRQCDLLNYVSIDIYME